MFRVVLYCAILASFSVGGADDPGLRRQCRAGVCDDRPVCPQSPCRCLYPSRADCALYYQCVNGKPRQYRCSQGLLFNEDTLTCDYASNVNCSIGKTTGSTTGVTTRVTMSEVPDNNTTTDHPSKSPSTSTETFSEDVSQTYSTEIYRTTASNEDSSTEATASDSPDLSIGTANANFTQSESYSKFTNTDDITTPDSPVKTTEASAFPSYSSSEASMSTNSSKSSDFLTETTNPTFRTEQSEAPKTTKSTSATKTDEPTGTANPVSVTEVSVPSDTTTFIFTDKESDGSETTKPSGTTKNEVSETTSSTSTAKEIEDTETTISTSKNSDESETTSPSSRTKEIEISESTSTVSTTEEIKDTETIIFTAKSNKVPETTSPSFRTKEVEVSETTIFTVKSSDEPETTTPSSRTKEIDVSEATISTSTDKDIRETTSSESTNVTTSKTGTANVYTEVTEHSVSTEETQPEVTTSNHSRNWTCPTRFGLYPDERDCHKFYHCSHWKPYHKKCPSNLHFNPALKVCDWPERAGCGSTVSTASTQLTTISPAQQTTTESGNNVSSCGCDSCELPIPGDCNSYILCIDRHPTLISCGDGLNFNVKTGTCDWEESVVCETNLQCLRPTGRFPYPGSCYHFIDCNDTVMTVNKCPEGAVYVENEEKCSWTAVCHDIDTSAETTSSTKYDGTTVFEISTRIPNSERTDSVEETTTEDNFTTYKDETSSELISVSTSRATSKKPEKTSTPVNTSTSRFPTTYEKTTTNVDLTTYKTTVSDKKYITTTLSSQTQMDTTQTNKSQNITTIETNTTEKFTEIPTTASMPSESVPDSSNQDFISTHATKFDTSSDSFSTESDLTSFPTKVSTISRATEVIISTEINSNASTSTHTGSSFPDETSANSVDFTDASTKRLITESVPISSNQDNISTQSTSSISFITESDLTYSSTEASTITEEIFSTENNANASTSTRTGSSSPDEMTANSVDFTKMTANSVDVDASTKRLTTESVPVSSNQDFISTNSTSSDSISTETDLIHSSKGASTIGGTTELLISTDTSTSITGSSLPDETSTNSVDFTDSSTKRLITIIMSSTELSKSSPTEDHSVVTGVTSTNTASQSTGDYRRSTSDASNATLSTTEAVANSSFVCPSRFGLFPDPDSCFRFYHCSHWKAHHKWCPSGLHFSPSLQVCDWPYRAGCGESPVVSTPITIEPKEDDGSFDESCDCECCFYPSKSDCSKYTLCLDGVPHRGQCTEGLLFNPLDHNCDLAERVTCQQGCPAPNAVYPHPSLCTAFYKCVDGRPTLQRCPEGEHFKAADRRCTDPCDADCDKTMSCNRPEANCDKSDALLPADGDCSSYYQCTEGHVYFVKCPDGTHFNSEYEVCEPPCQAGCDPTIECPSPVQHASSKSLDIPTQQCRQKNGLFPATEDCGSYYLCVARRPHLLRCPPGMHYSAEGGSCDTPCNAQCDQNIVSECTRLKSRDPKKSLPLSLHLPLWLQCKIQPNVTLSNPKNCSSFYACSEGVARLVSCPRGLHFDPEDKECKSPCLAGCDPSIQCPLEIPLPKGKCYCEDCYLPDASDCSAFLFCKKGSLTKGYCPRGMLFDRSSGHCRDTSRVVCEAIADPVLCLTPSGNFPHPGDCSKFIQCEDSVALVRDCTDGLEFDPEIRACVNPKGNCDSTRMDPLCEEATGQFAHPKNSSLFYLCENGVKFLKSCSPPLVYNALDQVCDWPHNVQDNSIEEIPKTQGSEGEITEDGSASSAHKNADNSRNSRDKSCHMVPGVTCPCACRVTTYDDCESFYQCRQDGKVCERRCPEGLYFNRKSMVCDLPQNVECRDFFFATLRRLKSVKVVGASLKYPLQAANLSRTSRYRQ